MASVLTPESGRRIVRRPSRYLERGGCCSAGGSPLSCGQWHPETARRVRPFFSKALLHPDRLTVLGTPCPRRTLTRHPLPRLLRLGLINQLKTAWTHELDLRCVTPSYGTRLYVKLTEQPDA